MGNARVIEDHERIYGHVDHDILRSLGVTVDETRPGFHRSAERGCWWCDGNGQSYEVRFALIRKYPHPAYRRIRVGIDPLYQRGDLRPARPVKEGVRAVAR